MVGEVYFGENSSSVVSYSQVTVAEGFENVDFGGVLEWHSNTADEFAVGSLLPTISYEDLIDG